MEAIDYIRMILYILLFGVGFLLGENDGQRRGSKSMLLVAGETWDRCDAVDLVIHADGHGVKMTRCWKDVTVDLKGAR